MNANGRDEDGGAGAPSSALARFIREELGEAASPDQPAGWQHSGPVWVWRGTGANGMPAKGAWYFLTIDGPVAEDIRAAAGAGGRGGGFGSVKVVAVIGGTRWATSLFPSKELHGYLLPLKAGVRRAESLEEGVVTTVTLTLA